MRFEPTGLSGAWLLKPRVFQDERGHFATLWDTESLRAHELPLPMRSNLSYNPHPGTLRGLHYQLPPYAEAKLIRCTRGRIFDVGIDLRRDSPSFLQSFGIELSDENLTQLYLPEGFAHAYLTLSPDTEVLYMSSGPYAPDAARGLRWNDPALSIAWPAAILSIAERDATYPDLDIDELPEHW